MAGSELEPDEQSPQRAPVAVRLAALSVAVLAAVWLGLHLWSCHRADQALQQAIGQLEARLASTATTLDPKTREGIRASLAALDQVITVHHCHTPEIQFSKWVVVYQVFDECLPHWRRPGAFEREQP